MISSPADALTGARPAASCSSTGGESGENIGMPLQQLEPPRVGGSLSNPNQLACVRIAKIGSSKPTTTSVQRTPKAFHEHRAITAPAATVA
jgi:hypothetical protein